MPISWPALPMRIQAFTGFLPLWCGIATAGQAETLVREHHRNPDTFHAAYGVRTLSRREPMYSLAASGNPSNWLGPIWLVVNYLTWKGLRRYGFVAEAGDLAAKTVRLLQTDLAANGCLHEYYHPETGEPLINPGFLDWNMLVLEMAEVGKRQG
jgi:putative isomerase